MRVRAERDLVAGILYITIAAGFLWFGRDLRIGSASRMGPGYFPLVLGWILCGFGVLSVARSFLSAGAPIGGVAWRKLAIVSTATVAFAFLLGKAGVIFAIPALIVISALSSEQSRFDLRGLLALVALTAFCVLVFVKGLGVPMPIFGTWFNDLVPATWQR